MKTLVEGSGKSGKIEKPRGTHKNMLWPGGKGLENRK